MIRVLFVDDEQNVLDGLKRTLRPLREEWTVAFANGGRKALELLGTPGFDAVITDMRMPGMDGLTLLRQVAERHPTLLRVVLSGQSEMEGLAKSAGATHHYLAKPCSLDVLRSTVNRAFSLRHLFADPALLTLVADINWDRSNVIQRASPDELSEILLGSPELYTSLLQLAQRAGFFKGQIKSDAVGLVHVLGLSTIKGLLLGADFCRRVVNPKPDGIAQERFHIDDLWRHRSACSFYAEKIVRFLMPSDGEIHGQAQVAGLLLDVGQLVMRCHFPESYQLVEDLAAHELTGMAHAEKKIFGVSHAELSAYILAEAGLPDVIVEAVAYHHSPSACPDSDSQLLLAIHVADVLSRDSGDNELSLDTAYLNAIGQAGDLAEWRKLIATHVN